MTLCAVNDCFSVTRLANHVLPAERSTPPPTIPEDDLLDEKEQVEMNYDEPRIYLSPPTDEDEPGGHVRDELLVSSESKSTNEREEEVHVANERPSGIEIISDDEIEPPVDPIYEKREETMKKQLTRSQRKNRKKRANRYQFETIRKIYHRFSISAVKTILIDMNVHYVNMNVVDHTLFIGLRDEPMRKHVDDLLHQGMFTKEHYYRIQKRARRY